MTWSSILTASVGPDDQRIPVAHKPVGTLATGTTSGRVFSISFRSDGTNLYETGRTAAMVA